MHVPSFLFRLRQLQKKKIIEQEQSRENCHNCWKKTLIVRIRFCADIPWERWQWKYLTYTRLLIIGDRDTRVWGDRTLGAADCILLEFLEMRQGNFCNYELVLDTRYWCSSLPSIKFNLRGQHSTWTFNIQADGSSFCGLQHMQVGSSWKGRFGSFCGWVKSQKLPMKPQIHQTSPAIIDFNAEDSLHLNPTKMLLQKGKAAKKDFQWKNNKMSPAWGYDFKCSFYCSL